MILSTCVHVVSQKRLLLWDHHIYPENSLEQDISVRYVVYDTISSCTRILELCEGIKLIRLT